MPASNASPTSHSYFSQRLRLHYLDWGNENAAPLLLIHGIHDHCHSWDWVARELCDDFHVMAPDLRGHGDSEWATGTTYKHTEYVYDIAQLVHQTKTAPLSIVAHSMGGTLACMYAGTYPENVDKLVILEGVGPHPFWSRMGRNPQERMRNWIDSMRKLSGRISKRYSSQEEAYQRMQRANPHLSPEQARHLSIHGSNQNEDGTYTWKFDNYTYARTLYDMSTDETMELWGNITCPVLLITASDGYPGRIGQNDTLGKFPNARLEVIQDAGHWAHHDQLETFIALTREFLR
jgi:pimeloyl-ACP methyl ester carboxylesterase